MTLQLYFARRFTVTFILVMLIFTGLIFLTDMVEQLRRFQGQAITLGQAAGLSALNSPKSIYQVLPILMIIATVTLFLRMARTSELVVTRAAGRSALRSLVAPLVVAFTFGVISVTVLNPIVAATSDRYATVTSELRYGARNVLSVSSEGLWLRQSASAGQVVIQAQGANGNGTELLDVMFLGFTLEGRPAFRIEAARAQLTPGAWELTDAKRWIIAAGRNPEANAETLASLRLPTDLTPDRILEGFGNPGTIPIWELPKFIARLEQAGFSARAHRVWLQMELASPLLLMAMVLIGAGFTMRHTRMGKTGLMVLFAVLMGFGMFFLKSFAQILGDTGKIPVLLAAWTPPVAGVMLSLGMLLHTEDG